MANPIDWYADSREAIQVYYGEDWQLFCKLLAACSPNCSLPSNLTLAQKAYNLIKTEEELPKAGFIKAHYSQVTKMLVGDKPGRKVGNFYQNLIGNEQAITVDVWMARYYGLKRPKAISAKDYTYVEDCVRMDADYAGLTPAQFQAKTWCMVRGSSENFGDLLRSRGRQLSF
uniref:Uncharacterized protein n=1 Tax=viral metagenome TaxID=1070528 RepID=A0A6M3JDS5_9ZZZZ